jgi:hypothetical protein
VCLDAPPSLSSQTIPTRAPPAPVRCVSEQGFSLPAPMCAVPPIRGETRHAYVLPQSVLDAVASLGAARQAVIRRSGSCRYRALGNSQA